jgi:ribosomal protein S2
MRIGFRLSQFIAADLFLGFSVQNWNSRINYFLLGKRHGQNLFNLNLTYFLIKKSVFLLNSVLSKNGILWVICEDFLSVSRMLYFHSYLKNNKIFKMNKWLNGLLTNYKNFEEFYMFPHIMFLMNLTLSKYTANEAAAIGIPAIGLVDTNENPTNLPYPITANSKGLNSSVFFLLVIFRLLINNRIEASRIFRLKLKIKKKVCSSKLLTYLSLFAMLNFNLGDKKPF